HINIRTSRPLLSMLDRFSATNPMAGAAALAQHINRARSLVGNEKLLSTQATLTIGGQQRQQQLLVPYVAAAATEVWGEEIAYFLTEPFIEADVAAQLSFQRIQALVESAMQARPPEEIHEPDVSITP